MLFIIYTTDFANICLHAFWLHIFTTPFFLFGEEEVFHKHWSLKWKRLKKSLFHSFTEDCPKFFTSTNIIWSDRSSCNNSEWQRSKWSRKVKPFNQWKILSADNFYFPKLKKQNDVFCNSSCSLRVNVNIQIM